jgi:hypothetical protein
MLTSTHINVTLYAFFTVLTVLLVLKGRISAVF